MTDIDKIMDLMRSVLIKKDFIDGKTVYRPIKGTSVQTCYYVLYEIQRILGINRIILEVSNE